jgi:hypothetical protein
MWVLKVFSHLEPRKKTPNYSQLQQTKASPLWLEKYLESRAAELKDLGMCALKSPSLGEIAMSESKWNGGNFFDVMCFPWKGWETYKLDAGLNLAAAPSLQFNRPRGRRLTYTNGIMMAASIHYKKAEASRAQRNIQKGWKRAQLLSKRKKVCRCTMLARD